jgi:predicted RNA polymerase sigma factor
LLHAIAPSLGGGVALAAVTAEVDGPAVGLAALGALLEQAGEQARRFQPARATRAHLLDRLGRSQEAVMAYESAIALTHDTAERQYLEQRRDRASRQASTQPGRSSGRLAASSPCSRPVDCPTSIRYPSGSRM